MKYILIISIILSKLILASYNDKYCVAFPFDEGNVANWLTPFNGKYAYNGLVNGKPSWKQISCSYKDSDCTTERKLHYTESRWEFTDGIPGSPSCADNPQPNQPEKCTKWWGYDGPDKVLVEGCGNEIQDGETPHPTTSTSTTTTTSTSTTTSVPASSGKYNLIDASPSCYNKQLCSYGAPGATNSIHPNPEERIQAVFHNIARLYPQTYIQSKYGKYRFGTYGDPTIYSQTGNCAHRQYVVTTPMYWSSEPNQMARFSQMYITESGTDSHSTSDKYCTLFNGDCSPSARGNKFISSGGPQYSAEGLIGANMAYLDGHCDAIFDVNIRYDGIGFWPIKSNGITADYFINGPDINYALPAGTHFDERLKLKTDDYNADKKYLTFLLEFYSTSDSVKNAYVLHNGQAEIMKLSYGSSASGFYEAHAFVPSKCAPYAFFVNTINGKSYRLPEDVRYFYGTATVEYPWSRKEVNVPVSGQECFENHYYQNDKGKWIPNASDKFDNNNQACVGCDAIDVLISAYNTKKQ